MCYPSYIFIWYQGLWILESLKRIGQFEIYKTCLFDQKNKDDLRISLINMKLLGPSTMETSLINAMVVTAAWGRDKLYPHSISSSTWLPCGSSGIILHRSHSATFIKDESIYWWFLLSQSVSLGLMVGLRTPLRQYSIQS